MGLIQNLFGKSTAKADALDSAEAGQTALTRLAQEREDARRTIDESLAKRRELLLIDGSDAKIAELDKSVDAAHLILERLDLAEPAIHARLRELQDESRRDLLAQMTDVMGAKERSLDAALENVAEIWADYINARDQMFALGFEAQANAFFPLPGCVAEGPVASAANIERWRVERERRADQAALAAAGKPLSPRPVAPPPVRPKPVVVPAQRQAFPRRAPQKCAETPTFGMAKICVLRSGLEIAERQHVAGDTLVLPVAQAEALARAAACDILEIGQPEGKAAE